ncbi:hypothetical protein MTO96_005530 [Rhipicephalus appendiculatus]
MQGNVRAISCSLSCKDSDIHDETPSDTTTGNPSIEPHVSDFWTVLVQDITERQAWRVKAFDEIGERLLDAYSEDVCHYPLPEERIRMKHRRHAALKFRADPERWSRLVLAGLREAGRRRIGGPGHCSHRTLGVAARLPRLCDSYSLLSRYARRVSSGMSFLPSLVAAWK